MRLAAGRRGTLLPVLVVPGAARDQWAGPHGDGVRVRVSAPPERGRANEAVCRVVAERLGVPAHSVRVARGAASRRKVLEIVGLDPAETAARLRE